jgi:hypothetical protein
MKTPNFVAKMIWNRKRLARIKQRQKEHFRQFKRLRRWNINFKACINVLNTISVTSLVIKLSGATTTLFVVTVSNSLSAIGTAILSVINMDTKVHSHHTSYLQFVDLYDTYIAQLLHDNLDGKDLDRILTDLNTKVGLILDNCEPIELVEDSDSPRVHQTPPTATQQHPPNIDSSVVCSSIRQAVSPKNPQIRIRHIPPILPELNKPTTTALEETVSPDDDKDPPVCSV